MSVLVINERVRRAIAAMVERASKKPVPWEQMKRFVNFEDNKNFELPLKDRPPDFTRPESEHLRIGKYRIAFSFEQQPAGLLRHLSVSVPRVGRTPHPAAVEMIAREFGFTEFPPTAGRIWLEEFDPGHHAVNVVELVTAKAGRA